MKKIILSVATLAALTTTAFATPKTINIDTTTMSFAAGLKNNQAEAAWTISQDIGPLTETPKNISKIYGTLSSSEQYDFFIRSELGFKEFPEFNEYTQLKDVNLISEIGFDRFSLKKGGIASSITELASQKTNDGIRSNVYISYGLGYKKDDYQISAIARIGTAKFETKLEGQLDLTDTAYTNISASQVITYEGQLNTNVLIGLGYKF